MLGAPELFIIFPFLLEGVFITLLGGSISILLTTMTVKSLYLNMSSPIPFIPLPPQSVILNYILFFNIAFSFALGILGSYFGIMSSKER